MNQEKLGSRKGAKKKVFGIVGMKSGHHGLHIITGGNWMLLLHGYATTTFTDQKRARGDSKTYVQSMAMLAAERDTSFGRIQLKSMLSAEPLLKNSGYPNLFATGETDKGKPLVDRQHPHDLFIELAARADFNVADNTSLFLYGGPVGEPALGPNAFMCRESAKLNPEAPVTHHWFDSTHITYGVATAGIATLKLQLEASLFTGREPDEKRWNFEKPRFDSWSVRATWNLSPEWALQASHGRWEATVGRHTIRKAWLGALMPPFPTFLPSYDIDFFIGRQEGWKRNAE